MGVNTNTHWWDITRIALFVSKRTGFIVKTIKSHWVLANASHILSYPLCMALVWTPHYCLSWIFLP